ncbi:modulator of smoothened protein isoform X2 [Peromyscus maniculatus bairdii]|uniref:modulator of smoothened protein isoform X2 n=1 Tax=Peromyscus maniculatus bairdii TaxID=230844 RepID=UPI003FD1E5D0
MDKLTIISGCLFLAADIFAIASIANPDWINTGESAGALTVGLVRQCQTIHGRDRTCIPPRLPPEWVTTLFFIIMGIISLTVTCGLLVASHWRREATKYARWIAFTGRDLLCEKPVVNWRKDIFHQVLYPVSSKATTRHVLWTSGLSSDCPSVKWVMLKGSFVSWHYTTDMKY